MNPTTNDADLPFHMLGNYAPVLEEVDAFDLAVEGAIPTELTGRFIRNVHSCSNA